jgi:hypothetical protein
MSNLGVSIRALALTLVLCGLAILLFGCGQREKALSTGDVVPANAVTALLPGWYGDTHYAIVRHSALTDIDGEFRRVLSRQGLVKWDGRFDCNRFASLWIALAHTRYAVAAWHSTSPAQALALAEVWHTTPDGAHAIVAALTDKGLVFLEPQTGQIVPTPTGIYFVKW